MSNPPPSQSVRSLQLLGVRILPGRQAGALQGFGGIARAGRWLAFVATLGLQSACGEEAALSHGSNVPSKQGSKTEATSDASSEASSRPSDPSTATDSTFESSAPAPAPSSPDTYLVSEDDAVVEVTQVYNGETHVVGDISATLRASSADVDVYVQDALYGTVVTDEQLDGFLARLVARGDERAFATELGILPTNEAVFGKLQRDGLLGGKQRVFVVDTSGAGDGYLCGWCDYPDLHLDGNLVAPLDEDEAFSISAHELYHAIGRGYDSDEEVWMDESMAEAAMTVNGYFTDQAWLSDFLANPNQDWGPNGRDVTSVHYGACLAWGTYLWEQGGTELMRGVTEESANGWQGVDAALRAFGDGRTAWELFLEMGAALYFDEPERGLGFRSFDMPRQLRVTPVSPGTHRDDALEAYGLLFYEVAEPASVTLEGDGISAIFVTEAEALAVDALTIGEAFDTLGAGVVVVSAPAPTAVSISVE